MVERKKTAPAVVTEGAAQAVLRRGAARRLSPEEEKLLRMRLGASPPRTEALQRVGQGVVDTEIELLAREIEAFLKLKRRRPGAAAPGPSRAKERIIRALRKKGR